MDYNKLAKFIIKYVGGNNNIIDLTHCATRLRFKLKNENITKTDKIVKLDGVLTVLNKGGQYQVVIGEAVVAVFEEAMKLRTCEEEDIEERNIEEKNFGEENIYDYETALDEYKNCNVKRIEKIEDVGFIPKIEKIISGIFKKKK